MPKRILLLNGAHIGDVIIATSVIPVLRSAFPSAEIGFATGSWSQIVVSGRPDIIYTHCIDHWRYNRGADSPYMKWAHYRRSRAKALKEIRAVGYDTAICVSTFDPDFLNFAAAAGIPTRIGFRHSFFAHFATRWADQPLSPFAHQSDRFVALLRTLPIDSIHFDRKKYSLGPSNSAALQELQAILAQANRHERPYRIVHMGSGAFHRELPLQFWREFAETFPRDCTLVFTGRGTREAKNIEEAIHGLQNCISACDRLSWNGFVAAVRNAELLYGVESMAGHVAAAVGTRCVVAYTGISGVARWRPEGNQCTVFSIHVACSPCYKKSGCPEMTCLHGVNPKELALLG
jgi:ADP-heptose:LPS heptosyltransferase